MCIRDRLFSTTYSSVYGVSMLLLLARRQYGPLPTVVLPPWVPFLLAVGSFVRSIQMNMAMQAATAVTVPPPVEMALRYLDGDRTRGHASRAIHAALTDTATGSIPVVALGSLCKHAWPSPNASPCVR